MAETVTTLYSFETDIDAEFASITAGMEQVGRVAAGAEANLLPSRIEGRYNRRNHVASANFEGMTAERQRKMTDMITDIGLPVDNIRTIAHQGEYNKGSLAGEKGWSTLATWTPAEGRFTTYDALDNLPEAALLDTTVHELTHGMSPFDPENAFLYGSEKARQEAAAQAENIATQSYLTGKFINGYQKKLAEQLADPESDVTWARFREETSAILTEHGMTDRAKLRQVQEAQTKEVDKLILQGKLNPNFKPVKLISDWLGSTPEGVDKQLVNLVDGVNSVAGIEMHVRSLKHKYQNSAHRQKSAARAAKHSPTLLV